MQAAQGIVAALALSALASSGPAAGGLVVQGAGFGQGSGSEGNGGPYVCEDVPFAVTAVFLPGDRGMLYMNWGSAAGSGDNCFVVSNGGAYAIGSTFYDLAAMPPVWHEPACAGNEARGLDCGAYGATGPYGGPGSMVWYRLAAPSSAFLGEFLAV